MPEFRSTVRYLRTFLSMVSLLVLTGCAVSLPFTTPTTYQHKNGETLLQIKGVAEDSLEILYVPATERPFPSFAKADIDDWPLNIQSTAKETLIKRGKLTAAIDHRTNEIRFFREEQLLFTQRPYQASASVLLEFTIDSDEKLMGAGQRVLGMDRRGHVLPLYNRAHYGYTTESTQMNYSLPAVMSSDRYYLLIDNTAKGSLDLAATEADLLKFEAVGGRASYIVGTDNSFPDLIDEYTDVTGKPAMLPRWALGHFISRFGYHTEQEVREVVGLTQEHDIPADAVIIDLYWFGPAIRGYMGNLDWDYDDFPTPQGMIDDLAEDNVRTILITEPFILTTSTRWQDAVDAGAIATNIDGQPYKYDFYFGNTGLVDIFKDEGREWFAERYKDIFAQGVAGNWGDLGEPEVHPDDIQHVISGAGMTARGDVVHNAYGHEWAGLVYETQKELMPDSRPFILMRSGFAGSQRFGIIPWTGDVSRSWGGLKPQVELSLTMGLFGLGYTHSDIGGFAGTEGFEDELYLRWSQYGIFQPIYRPHAQEQIASEVVFQEPEIRDIVTDFINLRYQLTPYNYSLVYEHHTTGMPMMRPMFFYDEDNLQLIDEKDQYFWGDDFLVKPVTDPGLSELSMHLPAGDWFNFFTGELHPGGQTIEVSFDKRSIPVMVRAGAFIPMVERHQNNANYSSEQLTLHYYHSATVRRSSGMMYEDDGESASAITRGAYEKLLFKSLYEKQVLQLMLSREGRGYEGMPEQRDVEIIIHGWTSMPASVSVGEQVIPIDQLIYDSATKQLKFHLNWDHLASQITIK